MVAIETGDLDFLDVGPMSLCLRSDPGPIAITLVSLSTVDTSKFLAQSGHLGWLRRRKLMVGRFPIAVINIQIDPYLADVMSHPTKQEVRISKERGLVAP